MRLEQLRYLITLSRNPSITSASQKLYLTPSALSTAIKNLEKEIGITLINRTYTGISLTDAGKKLVKSSQRFLLDIDNIVKEAAPEAFSTMTGHVHFYASPHALDTVLPRIICLFYKTYPLISVTSTRAANNEIIEYIAKDPMEFAMLHIMPGQDFRGLDFHPLYESQILLQVSASDPLARYDSVSFKTISDQTVIVHTTSEVNTNFCNKLFDRYGQPQKVIFEQNAKLCEEMIAQELGIGLNLDMPLQTPLPTDQRYAFIRVKDLPKFEFGYLLNPEAALTLPCETFIHHLTAYLTENIAPTHLLL